MERWKTELSFAKCAGGRSKVQEGWGMGGDIDQKKVTEKKQSDNLFDTPIV